MENYMQMHKDFETKLNRPLTEDEEAFLQWVFKRYLHEISTQSIIPPI